MVHTTESVIKLFRDHGNRADRKRARIKYLVHDWGAEKFRDVLAGYLGGMPELPQEVEVSGFELHLGWHPQGDGKWFYGLRSRMAALRTRAFAASAFGPARYCRAVPPGLATDAVCRTFCCAICPAATCRPSGTDARRIRHCSLPNQYQQRTAIQHGLPGHSDVRPGHLRIGAGLAGHHRRTGSAAAAAWVWSDEKLGVRMTGCPNGCARPYQSDIGIVGRQGDKYTLFVGGHVLGHRLNFSLLDLLPRGEIVSALVPLLGHFKEQRRKGESFGDFCQRLGPDALRALLPASAT